MVYVIFKALAEILEKVDSIMDKMNQQHYDLKEMLLKEKKSDNVEELYKDLPEL